jgi:hypothetical protein
MDFGPVVVDPSVQFKLLDRVVSIREDFAVPLGLTGTVIGKLNIFEIDFST